MVPCVAAGAAAGAAAGKASVASTASAASASVRRGLISVVLRIAGQSPGIVGAVAPVSLTYGASHGRAVKILTPTARGPLLHDGCEACCRRHNASVSSASVRFL